MQGLSHSGAIGLFKQVKEGQIELQVSRRLVTISNSYSFWSLCMVGFVNPPTDGGSDLERPVEGHPLVSRARLSTHRPAPQWEGWIHTSVTPGQTDPQTLTHPSYLFLPVLKKTLPTASLYDIQAKGIYFPHDLLCGANVKKKKLKTQIIL